MGRIITAGKIDVDGNEIEPSLKALKKQMLKDGVFPGMKRRAFHEKPSTSAMSARRSAVLLLLPRDVVDQARVLAGKATTELKLPVSLQIVLRALIQDGLRRSADASLRAAIEREAVVVRERRAARRRQARTVPERTHARKER